MTLEQITEWLWTHPPQACDAVDMATRNDLLEQVRELSALVARQERAVGHAHKNSWVNNRG